MEYGIELVIHRSAIYHLLLDDILLDRGVFYTNYVTNLTSVCSRCHDKLHASGSSGTGGNSHLKRVKTTRGYVLR
jgi:hypothetical protein